MKSSRRGCPSHSVASVGQLGSNRKGTIRMTATAHLQLSMLLLLSLLLCLIKYHAMNASDGMQV
jgi:hypothetical protein